MDPDSSVDSGTKRESDQVDPINVPASAIINIPPDSDDNGLDEDPTKDEQLAEALSSPGYVYDYDQHLYEQQQAAILAPKLEVIAENEIWETPSTVGIVVGVVDESGGGNILNSPTSPILFNAGAEIDPLLTRSDLYVQQGIEGASKPAASIGSDDTTGRSENRVVLQRYFSEPGDTKLKNLFKQMSSRVGQRLFGSSAITPNDSLQSMEFGTSARSNISGPNRSRRFAGDSSRNSVCSDMVFANNPMALSKSRKLIGPGGQVVSRSNRFVTKGTAGFLLTKNRSAISLRLPESGNVLPMPCAECPHCIRFLKMDELPRSLGKACRCRICVILLQNTPGAPPLLKLQAVTRGKTIGGLGNKRKTSAIADKLDLTRVPTDYGAMCETCSIASSAHAMPLHPVVFERSISHVIDDLASQSNESGHRRLNVMASNRSICSVVTNRSNLLYCRICHSPGDTEQPLISPCRCRGSLKYVHMYCLVHWLEICCRKMRRPAQCELCSYKYNRHKTFRLRGCTFPKCAPRDKMYHCTFLVAIITMIASISVTFVCFRTEKSRKGITGSSNANQMKHEVELNASEVLTLICGVLFFCAFFVAMYAQVKAKTTLYKLALRFWLMNHEWYIDEYNPEKDSHRLTSPELTLKAMSRVDQGSNPRSLNKSGDADSIGSATSSRSSLGGSQPSDNHLERLENERGSLVMEPMRRVSHRRSASADDLPSFADHHSNMGIT